MSCLLHSEVLMMENVSGRTWDQIPGIWIKPAGLLCQLVELE